MLHFAPRASLFFLLAVMLIRAAVPAAEPVPSTVAVAETHFFYEDLARAERFYREHLGLLPVERRRDAVVLEVAPGARLVLATLESGGYTPDTPRTAAVALITDQLDEWWAVLSQRPLDMRTETYDPEAGRAHHGFVLADPEGWLLEFERFNPHPENERLMPLLDVLPTWHVDRDVAELPDGLGFKATVLWFYYDDLAAAEAFAIDGLALPLVADQGWAKIHPLNATAFLGLVDGARGMHPFTEEKAVALELVDPRIDERIEELKSRGLQPRAREDGVFEVEDSGGYELRYRMTGTRLRPRP